MNEKYIYWLFKSPINESNIDITEQIKLANMNALDACLPSEIDPMKATIQITRSITGMNVPETPLFTNLKRVYKFVVSVAFIVGYGVVILKFV